MKEGVILSADEVTEAFRSASDEFPRYSVVPETFHITTEYMPETTHEDLYGTEVTVHITGYKYGTSTDETDGSTQIMSIVVNLLAGKCIYGRNNRSVYR